ncbi:MAG: cysteine peptidase family C39 domain-containing protein [Candidatus Aenigmatarchaeota archaeon]
MNKRIVFIIILIFLFVIIRFPFCLKATNFEIKSYKELRVGETIIQTHEYSCGAAALATLMNMMGGRAEEKDVLYSIFGDNLPLIKKGNKYELRALTLADLEKAGKDKKFKVLSFQALEGNDALKLISELKPVIARINLYDEKLHFVVIKDINDGWISILDPGYGSFVVPISDFISWWESGERILLTISRYPFYVWQDEKNKEIFYIKRNEKEIKTLETKQYYFPFKDLYYSIKKINTNFIR